MLAITFSLMSLMWTAFIKAAKATWNSLRTLRTICDQVDILQMYYSREEAFCFWFAQIENFNYYKLNLYKSSGFNKNLFIGILKLKIC